MRALKASFLAVSLLFLGCREEASSPLATITKKNGETLLVRVEIADTPELRGRGLMFRKELPEGTGMLFLFPAETYNAFWMKNTPIPLDMIFIKQGRIVSIIESAKPYDEKILQPDSAYTMTLEVPGGYTSGHGVLLGDRFEWRR
jgi:hypothetical protein